MKVLSTLEPLQRRNLLVLFAAGLLFWSSLGSLLPTIPTYIKDIGGSDRELGIVIGAFAVGLLMSRRWVGNLTDRRGRKLVLILGALVAAIAPIGFIFVKSIPLLVILRAFHGISIAAFTTGYSALVVDLSPAHQRGEIIGYMSLVTPVGIAIGPAIGGLLQASFGYTPLFLFSAAIAIVSLLGCRQIQEPSPPENLSTDAPTDANSEKFWLLLLSPRLYVPTIVLLLIGVSFGGLHAFVPLLLREAQVALNAGWFYAVGAIASFSFRIFIGRASDVYGRGIFITLSLIGYAIAMLMIALATTSTTFILGAFLEGAASGTLMPIIIALISDRSSAEERGRVFSLGVSGLDVGIAIGGGIFGFVAESMGYQGIFLICTALSIVALIFFATLSSKDLSHSLRFALGKEQDIYALKSKI